MKNKKISFLILIVILNGCNKGIKTDNKDASNSIVSGVQYCHATCPSTNTQVTNSENTMITLMDVAQQCQNWAGVAAQPCPNDSNFILTIGGQYYTNNVSFQCTQGEGCNRLLAVNSTPVPPCGSNDPNNPLEGCSCCSNTTTSGGISLFGENISGSTTTTYFVTNGNCSTLQNNLNYLASLTPSFSIANINVPASFSVNFFSSSYSTANLPSCTNYYASNGSINFVSSQGGQTYSYPSNVQESGYWSSYCQAVTSAGQVPLNSTGTCVTTADGLNVTSSEYGVGNTSPCYTANSGTSFPPYWCSNCSIADTQGSLNCW